jgi:DNA-binding phage protein
MNTLEHLRALIESSGRTVNSIAVQAGVTQPTVWRFVHRRHEDVKLTTVEKLLSAFGLELYTRKAS